MPTGAYRDRKKKGGQPIGTLFTPEHTVSQPFTGTIAGLSLTGRATPDLKTFSKLFTPHFSPSARNPASLVIFHWTGTLGGTPFALSVAEVLVAPVRTTSAGASLDITGTFGSQPVRATARHGQNRSTRVLTVSGSVGNLSFTGRVEQPVASQGSSSSTATFTLSH